MIYLIYSDHSTQIRSTIKKILKESLPEIDDISFVRYDGENVLLQEIIDDAYNMPLGYDRKAIEVDNCYFLLKPKPKNKIEADQDYKFFFQYLKNPNPDCNLILTVSSSAINKTSDIYKIIENAGDSNAKIIELTLDVKNWEQIVDNYIKGILQKNPGYRIDRDAVKELANRTRADIPLLKNSVAKLFLYTKHITYEDVLLLVAKPLDDNIFDIFNFLIDQKNDQALGLYRDLIVNNKNIHITLISQLGNQFRLLNEVTYLSKQGLSSDDIAKELNINPWRAKILKRYTYSVSEKCIHRTLDELFKLDSEIKSNLVDRFLAFELFLINFKRD